MHYLVININFASLIYFLSCIYLLSVLYLDVFRFQLPFILVLKSHYKLCYHNVIMKLTCPWFSNPYLIARLSASSGPPSTRTAQLFVYRGLSSSLCLCLGSALTEATRITREKTACHILFLVDQCRSARAYEIF